jgi:hypothetical protein
MNGSAQDAWINFGAQGTVTPVAQQAHTNPTARAGSWWPRGLRPWFVEDDAQPLPLKWGMRLRKWTYVFIWVATLLILFAELAEQLATTSGDALSTVVWTVLLTWIHLSYLQLIFLLLILSSLPHRQFKQRIWFPALFFSYCVANFFYALEVYRTYSGATTFPQARFWALTLHYVALALLALYYLAWLLRDYFKREDIPVEERVPNMFWLSVEGISLLILLLRIADLSRGFLPPSAAAYSETFVLALSLSLWKVLQWQEGWFLKETFRGTYQDYLKEIPNPVVFEPSKFANASINPSNIKRVLDFGCGDGRRLKENLQWLGLTQLPGLAIHGFDTNNTWKEEFLDNFSGTSAEFISSRRRLRQNVHYDLVVVSHCLYDVKAMQDLIAFLKNCDSGTKVLVRGTSPTSFFYLVSRVQASRLLGRSQASYSWDQWALPTVIKEAKLQSAARTNIGQPDGVVLQRYTLTKKTAVYAAKLLGDLFGGNTHESVLDVFNELHCRRNIGELPNDDFIYVFEKVS